MRQGDRDLQNLTLRRLGDLRPFLAEIEEGFRPEAEGFGEQHGREGLDAGIVLADRAVVEAPRRGDLAFDIGELLLQFEEVLVRLQVGIGLRNGDQAAERARQGLLGLGLLRRTLRGGDRGRARLHHLVERALLMGRIALHRLDEIGNEVMALLHLHVDIGEGLLDALSQADEAVIGHDAEAGDHDEDDENHGAGVHRLPSCICVDAALGARRPAGRVGAASLWHVCARPAFVIGDDGDRRQGSAGSNKNDDERRRPRRQAGPRGRSRQ